MGAKKDLRELWDDFYAITGVLSYCVSEFETMKKALDDRKFDVFFNQLDDEQKAIINNRLAYQDRQSHINAYNFVEKKIQGVLKEHHVSTLLD